MKEGGAIILAVVLLPLAPCAGDAVFHCERETTLFGLEISVFTTLFQNSSTQILEYVQHILPSIISWSWESSLQFSGTNAVSIKWSNSSFARTVWRCKYVFIFKESPTDYSNVSFEQCRVGLVVSPITNADVVKRQYKSLYLAIISPMDATSASFIMGFIVFVSAPGHGITLR